MAQGKAFTEEQKNMIIQSLKDYLELGFSRNKACELVGLTPSTLSTWVTADEALRIKIQSWENAMNKVALANIRDALQKEAETEDARKETSKWWAERRMKADFSPKVEQEFSNPDGNLKTLVIIKDNGITDQTSSETNESI